MKSGTTPADIKIRRYGSVPPPAVELEERAGPARSPSLWRTVSMLCAGLALAVSAVASVAFLFG